MILKVIIIYLIVLVQWSISSVFDDEEVAKSPVRRIAGGHPVTTIAKYPFVVEIRIGIHTCGGTILSRHDIMSAAHCFYGRNCLGDMTVMAGSELAEKGTAVRVKGVVIHPEYSHTRNDIAILHTKERIGKIDSEEGFHCSEEEAGVLKKTGKKESLHRKTSYSKWSYLDQTQWDRLNFNLRIGKATLPALNSELKVKTRVIPIGWGSQYEGGPMSKVLREVEIFVIDSKRCDELYRRLIENGQITDRMICAGVLDRGEKDTCQGDSGGPLITSSDYKVVGITSWGVSCASGVAPGVYTKVSKYIDWINNSLASDSGRHFRGEYYAEHCAASTLDPNLKILLVLFMSFLFL